LVTQASHEFAASCERYRSAAIEIEAIASYELAGVLLGELAATVNDAPTKAAESISPVDGS